MRRVLVLLALVTSPAVAADDITSVDMDLGIEDCIVMETSDFGTSWACPGHKGYPVQVSERGVRSYVSYGFGAGEERAAEQSPPPFNYLGGKIEWRLSNESGGFRPFATIVRYFVDNDTETDGQVLVVTKIEPGATCHVAYVDALANTGAEELAREAADTMARGFDCANEPEIIGEFAAW